MKKLALIMLATALPIFPAYAQTEQPDQISTYFKEIDTSKDSSISLYESLEDSRFFFKALDRNKDGTITKEEYYESMEDIPDDDKQYDFEKFLKQHDLNKDGKVTEYENMTAHRENFKAMDTDGNGLLSFDEFRKGMKEQ